MKFTLPKGMRDIEPGEMANREYALAKIKAVLGSYGFRLVEPSSLENLETLTAMSGPVLENEIYAFEDKSKRKIGLRFDLTVGMARMVANSNSPKPVRLACISNMWRYDNPQYARYRSFFQWDVEIYGCAGQEADAEIIALTIDILKSLGLDFEIRISNRKLVEGFVLGLGVDKKNLMGVLRVIDKKTKISEKELSEEFEKYGLNKEKINKILEFCKSDMKGLSKYSSKNEMAKQGYEELKNLFSMLDAYKKSKKCRIDLSIVRGIDYYTGIVYEAWVKGEGDIGAIAGGGRYDNLLGIYGKEMPATGIAGGIERLLLSLEKNNLLPELQPVPEIFVAYATPDLFFSAAELAAKAREKGFSTMTDISKRDLRKQFEYANKLNVKYVIVIGEKELKSRKAKLRNMETGEEKEIGMDLEGLESL